MQGRDQGQGSRSQSSHSLEQQLPACGANTAEGTGGGPQLLLQCSTAPSWAVPSWQADPILPQGCQTAAGLGVLLSDLLPDPLTVECSAGDSQGLSISPWSSGGLGQH